MKNKKNLKLLNLCLLSILFKAEISNNLNNSIKRYEVEEVLNFVFNSPQFDTFYSKNIIYLTENEMINKSDSLTLNRKGRKIKFISRRSWFNRNNYFNIDDFTYVCAKDTVCRVQIYQIKKQRGLNLLLRKINNNWIIKNSMINKHKYLK